MRAPVDPLCEPGAERADLIDNPAIMARAGVAGAFAILFFIFFPGACRFIPAACRLADGEVLAAFGFAHPLGLQESDVIEEEPAALGEADLACGQPCGQICGLREQPGVAKHAPPDEHTFDT